MICLYGGTFDPVHNGHLHAARSVCGALAIDSIRLVLSARPSHRGGQGATMQQRWEMLTLACRSDPRLIPDDREMRRDAPSYTVETLEEIRAAEPDAAIVWVIGSDAYALLASWHRWQRLIELANLVVLQRPGYPLELDPLMTEFTSRHRVDAFESMRAGGVLLLDLEMLEISAAGVRARLAAGEPVDDLLPEGVANYIRAHSLYGVVSDP